MIIDMRTALDRLDAEAHPTADAETDLHCIDISVVVGDPTRAASQSDPAAHIAACVREAPGRRVGFLPVNPLAEDALEQVERGQELGLVGVTISPADQAYRPTHDACLELLERCVQMRLPVMVANPHLYEPQSLLEFARPVLLDEVLRQMPSLTLIVGDLGHGWIDESLTLIAKHDRVYAEISGVVRRPWALYSTLMSAYERGLLKKMLFGSGYPFENPERAIERIYTINSVRAGSSLPTIPREALRSLVERDALSCVGVRRPDTARPVREEPVAAGALPRPTPADEAEDLA